MGMARSTAGATARGACGAQPSWDRCRMRRRRLTAYIGSYGIYESPKASAAAGHLPADRDAHCLPSCSCHIHNRMSGRILLVNEDGSPIETNTTAPELYEPVANDEFDSMCGTYEASAFQVWRRSSCGGSLCPCLLSSSPAGAAGLERQLALPTTSQRLGRWRASAVHTGLLPPTPVTD
eukprot:364013-Chlamydomonas_euryale.AAC.10